MENIVLVALSDLAAQTHFDVVVLILICIHSVVPVKQINHIKLVGTRKWYLKMYFCSKYRMNRVKQKEIY